MNKRSHEVESNEKERLRDKLVLLVVIGQQEMLVSFYEVLSSI